MNVEYIDRNPIGFGIDDSGRVIVKDVFRPLAKDPIYDENLIKGTYVEGPTGDYPPDEEYNLFSIYKNS